VAPVSSFSIWPVASDILEFVAVVGGAALIAVAIMSIYFM
jgi:hypothetical protein